MTNRREFLQSFGLSLLAAGCAQAPKRPPSVVFILADDLGWRDTTLYGSNYYETPNIDALAARGMMFTEAYAASPICSPTRASIITGKHPARIGITTPSGHVEQEIFESTVRDLGPKNQPALQAVSATRLKHEYVTLAEVLKQAGYATAHFGKWHLGREPYDPLHQGFDLDIPHTPGPGPSGGYLGPWSFWPDQGVEGEHIEDRMASEASKFIKENRERPFFLNYWCFSVHAPMQGKPELVEKYRAKANPNAGQRNPVNGAMVESLDDGVGTLVKTIDELGLADDTIIVFFSDNGGMVHLVVEGIVVTSNAPLRSGKSSIYEGGVREPLIVVWPGVTEPGSKSGAVVQSVDFFPTLLEMTGIPAQTGQEFDGVSVAAALRGEPFERGPIFCHHPHYTPATAHKPSTSVRDGDWKLIRFYCDGPAQTDRYELYNLAEDIGETTDRAAENLAKVDELRRKIDAFLQETGAIIPQPNPQYEEGLVPFPDGPESKIVS